MRSQNANHPFIVSNIIKKPWFLATHFLPNILHSSIAEKSVSFPHLPQTMNLPVPLPHITHLFLPLPLHCTDDTVVRRGKVSTTTLPPEYLLSDFISHLGNPLPTWRADNPIGNWTHVECDAQGRVLSLYWGGLGLTGPLRWEALPLSLAWLDLGAVITGPGPLETNALCGSVAFDAFPPALRHCDLRHNAFEGGVDLNVLPATLEYLDISENRFSGTLAVKVLPEALVHLNVSKNQLIMPVNFISLLGAHRFVQF